MSNNQAAVYYFIIHHDAVDPKLAFISPDLWADSLGKRSYGQQGHLHQEERKSLAAQTDFG